MQIKAACKQTLDKSSLFVCVFYCHTRASRQPPRPSLTNVHIHTAPANSVWVITTWHSTKCLPDNPPSAVFQHYWWPWWRDAGVAVVTTCSPRCRTSSGCMCAMPARKLPQISVDIWQPLVSELVYSRCACVGGGAGCSGHLQTWIFLCF